MAQQAWRWEPATATRHPLAGRRQAQFDYQESRETQQSDCASPSRSETFRPELQRRRGEVEVGGQVFVAGC